MTDVKELMKHDARKIAHLLVSFHFGYMIYIYDKEGNKNIIFQTHNVKSILPFQLLHDDKLKLKNRLLDNNITHINNVNNFRDNKPISIDDFFSYLFN